MGEEEKIRKVNDEVEKAVNLIRAKHKGANLEEARKYLSEAGEVLKEDKLEEALEQARKAQLSARPTTDYLLSKAKELAADAEKNYRSKSYENAIDQWKKSLEEYHRGGELAQERKEKEIVERISEVEKKIKENISKAEIAIDSRELHELVASGAA